MGKQPRTGAKPLWVWPIWRSWLLVAVQRTGAVDPFKTPRPAWGQMRRMNAAQPDFTPALGRPELTGLYDRVLAVAAREHVWRRRLLEELAPQAGEVIVDLGAGTGSTAILIKAAAPGAQVIAVDPDPQVREIALAKAARAGVDFAYVTAMGDHLAAPEAGVDKVVSSLVLHQCPWKAKIAILRNAFRLLRPGGRLLIADYGRQRELLMDMLFRLVRTLDGYENTRANKDGLIPGLIAAQGFEAVEELSVTRTPTGSISLYSAWKPS